jgi:hypothetical protein
MAIIKNDDYIQIDVTYVTGFKFSIPARGYNLKSWITFHNSLSPYLSEHIHKVITKEKYDKLFYGDEPFSENGDKRRQKKIKQKKNEKITPTKINKNIK